MALDIYNQRSGATISYRDFNESKCDEMMIVLDGAYATASTTITREQAELIVEYLNKQLKRT